MIQLAASEHFMRVDCRVDRMALGEVGAIEGTMVQDDVKFGLRAGSEASLKRSVAYSRAEALQPDANVSNRRSSGVIRQATASGCLVVRCGFEVIYHYVASFWAVQGAEEQKHGRRLVLDFCC